MRENQFVVEARPLRVCVRTSFVVEARPLRVCVRTSFVVEARPLRACVKTSLWWKPGLYGREKAKIKFRGFSPGNQISTGIRGVLKRSIDNSQSSNGNFAKIQSTRKLRSHFKQNNHQTHHPEPKAKSQKSKAKNHLS
jgi:hypothetical protein